MSDPDVLGIAASQGRILVTHDFRTMPKHFADFLAAGGSSPGVFLVKVVAIDVPAAARTSLLKPS
jgi:hypothetical protein